MKRVTLIALAVLAFCIDIAVACSFPPGYEIAKPSHDILHRKSSTPAAPHVSLLSLQRGYGVADGASCNDAGTLTILVESQTDPGIVGYIFRRVRGEFPDAALPEAVIKPIDLGEGRRGFRFVWLDLQRGSSYLKPIDATVEVRQIARNGAEGDPTLLAIRHPGGSSLEVSR